MKAASRHAPFTSGACTSCHDPHRSKLGKLLQAPSPDLCLTCHQAIGERMKTETVHPPAARDCVRCHAPHSAAEKTLLARPPQKLCGDCHDLKGAAFTTAHLGIDPAAMHCVACHAPHSSKDPKLFREQQHPPFAARACDECHVVGGK